MHEGLDNEAMPVFETSHGQNVFQRKNDVQKDQVLHRSLSGREIRGKEEETEEEGGERES